MKLPIIGLLAVAASLAAQPTIAAQERPSPPTPTAALAGLRAERSADAVAILTQLHGPRPQSELDAFADSLVALAIAGYLSGAPGGADAEVALSISAFPEEQNAIPYAGAYDAIERIFTATESGAPLGAMADIDPRRALRLILELVRKDDFVACIARLRLVQMDEGKELARELSDSGAFVHWCPGDGLREEVTIALDPPVSSPDYILAILKMENADGVELAVAFLTQIEGRWEAEALDAFADSLVALAALGDNESPLAGRALEALEKSALPVHPAAWPYARAYDAVTRVFEATGSQAALESLARIDADRASAFLAEATRRDDLLSCKARTVLARLANGPRLLRELEAAGALKFRCEEDLQRAFSVSPQAT